jgi:hypothetical protein
MQNSLSVRKGVAALTFITGSFVVHGMAQATPIENSRATPMLASAISGILDNQIFQRTMPQNTATVTVKLENPPSTASYKYYVVSLLDDYGINRESVLGEGVYNGGSYITFNLSPQAKFKNIRISFSYDGNSPESLRWNGPKLNAGEVFLVAGQSNAANHGEVGASLVANALHRGVDVSNNTVLWKPLEEQKSYYATQETDPNINGSIWAEFAEKLGVTLQQSEGRSAPVPVAVLNVAFGGSALEFWQYSPSGSNTYGAGRYLFPRLALGGTTLNRLASNGANTCSFRAVLWHQGEANSERSFTQPNTIPGTSDVLGAADRKTYASMMTKLATDFRSQTGCAQPWMVASVSWESAYWWNYDGKPVSEKFRAETEIRKGQRYLWSHVPVNGSEPVFKAGPDTDLFSGDVSGYGAAGYRRDGVHLTAFGQDTHGDLWASRVANLINPGVAVVDEKAKLNQYGALAEAGTVWQAFQNQLFRTAEEMEYDNEGFRYWVQTKIANPGVDVAAGFAASDERYIRDTFQNILGRRPAFWEATYWVNQLASGATTRATLSGPNKAGYENTLSANGKKIFRLYMNVMGRTLPDVLQDAGGLSYWTSVLDNGQASESAIADTFRASAEYRVRNAFVKSFARQPSKSELDSWISQMGSSSDAELAQRIWSAVTP